MLQCNLGLKNKGGKDAQATLDAAAQLIELNDVDVACLQSCAAPHQDALGERLPRLDHRYGHLETALLSSIPMARPELVPLSKRRQCDDPNRRTLIVTRISDVLLVNACLSWNEAQAEDNAREASAFLGRRSGSAIVVGDFNQHPGSAALQIFRDAGFRDVWAALRPDEDGATFDDGKPRRIDYILERSDRPLCTSIQIVGDDPKFSDHLGLITEVDA